MNTEKALAIHARNRVKKGDEPKHIDTTESKKVDKPTVLGINLLTTGTIDFWLSPGNLVINITREQLAEYLLTLFKNDLTTSR